MNLIKDIQSFIPFNEQEKADKALFLKELASEKNLFTREEQAHFTTSIWVLNPEKTKTLMVYHNIYDSWSWIGGHADGEEDLAKVALRELLEETGVSCADICHAPNPDSPSDIFSLELLTVNGHEKRGSYVSSHLHLNVTFVAIAGENQVLRVNEEENSGVRWIGLDKVCEASTEPWIASRIYQKLISKGMAYHL